MKKLLVDTNVLIYESFEDSEHHKEATNIIYGSGEIIIPNLVMHEYVWILTRLFKVEYNNIARKLEQLSNEQNISFLCEEPTDIAGALRMAYEDKIPQHDINDYIILALAMRTKSQLATYDNRLRSAAIRRGVGIIPL